MVDSGRRRVIDLKHAIREVRIAQSERNDVVHDLRDAEQARLELLAEALEGVSKELPPDQDQYLLGILPGHPPRYWIDATSFVVMGRDKRQYEFVKDTRAGRTTLAESASLEVMVDAITRYLAERIVERERAIEGDWLNEAVRAKGGLLAARQPAGDNYALIWGLAGFGLGMISGMFLLLAYAWFSVG